MTSLITYDEALELGRLGDAAGIEALVERAWEVRRENFGERRAALRRLAARRAGLALRESKK